MSRRNLRLIACGGRGYDDRTAVFDSLDYIHARRHIALLIEGGATGADRLAREWAIDRGVAYQTFEAAWKDLSVPGVAVRRGRYGPYNAAAGHQRNGRMLTEGQATAVVAFPGGSGTADMVAQALAADVPVWQPFAEQLA